MGGQPRIRAALKWVLPVLVVGTGALLFNVLLGLLEEPAKKVLRYQPPLVRVLEVERQSSRLEVRSQGTVRPRTQTMLVAEVSGRIVEISPSLASGGFFEAGAVLCRIDESDYLLALVQAQASLARAKRLLALEESEAKVARSEWSRRRSGKPDPLAVREPQLAEARANAAAAEAQVKKAKLDLGRCRIRAPYAGRVGRRFVDPGQFVLPGSQLARVHAIDKVEVRLPIPDRDLAHLDLPEDFGASSGPLKGPEVLLTARFGGERRSWQARIVRVEGEIDPATAMLYLVAEVDDPYARKSLGERTPLPIGLYVEARIQGRDVSGVFVVPSEALRGKDQVQVVGKDRVLRSRRVEILRREQDSILVTGGLEDGQLLCLTRLDAVVKGMTVRILGDERR